MLTVTERASLKQRICSQAIILQLFEPDKGLETEALDLLSDRDLEYIHDQFTERLRHITEEASLALGEPVVPGTLWGKLVFYPVQENGYCYRWKPAEAEPYFFD